MPQSRHKGSRAVRIIQHISNCITVLSSPMDQTALIYFLYLRLAYDFCGSCVVVGDVSRMAVAALVLLRPGLCFSKNPKTESFLVLHLQASQQ